MSQARKRHRDDGGKKEDFSQLDAFTRHQILMNYHGSTKTNQCKSEVQMLIDNHRFIWDETNDDDASDLALKLAKKYYDKLVKEYCIADLQLYKQNKIGMRWRTEAEVFEGKGQFICGAKRCSRGVSKSSGRKESDSLFTWEVFFSYIEQSVKKHALVKLRLCSDCSDKLNYHHAHKKVEKKKSKSKRSRVDESVAGSSSAITSKQETPPTKIKEEIFSEAEEPEHATEKDNHEEQIWKSEPSEIEESNGADSFEQEIDDYLDQMFDA